MAYTQVPPNTGTVLSAQDAANIRQLWQKKVDMFEQTTDFFAQFEGESATSPIVVKNDTAKGAGQQITFTVMAGFYGEGKSGDSTFETTTDFEQNILNHYTLTVDWVRNATGITRRAEELLGMRDEIENHYADELGKWMGRIKTERMMMTFREKAGVTGNIVYSTGRQSDDTLLSTDTLAWDDIVNTGAQLEPMGGQPALLGHDKSNNEIRRMIVVGTTPGLVTLKTDDTFRQILREAGVRGDGNELFEGGFIDVDGHVIKKFNPIDHDGKGAIGSPWNPKAALSVAITAGTTTFAVQGGGFASGAAADTATLFFKWFANYAYAFLPTDTLSPDTTITRYFLIVNPRYGTGGDGKIGMYSYTAGNNGNQITILNRLGSAASGARVTTLGSVTWNTGPWAGLHTDAHPVGALVLPCNAKGVPLGDTVMMGAGAVLRGYGQFKNRRDQQAVDGNFVNRTYISSVFGQCLRTDAQGRAPGFLRIRHALSYPGLGIPAVTA